MYVCMYVCMYASTAGLIVYMPTKRRKKKIVYYHMNPLKGLGYTVCQKIQMQCNLTRKVKNLKVKIRRIYQKDESGSN